MSELNIELFKKIRDRIAEIPESFDQENWSTHSPVAPCGTAACIAGHAIICSAPTLSDGLAELRQLMSREDRDREVPARAAALLGLSGSWGTYIETGIESHAGETLMFDGQASHWPITFRKEFHYGDPAEAAVAYLDHIIETGKVLE